MPSILEIIERGGLFVINHSGGKDSQAMVSIVRRIVPAEQLLVIHAELPEVDWEGIPEHIEETIGGLPLICCRSVKTFFQMVAHRGMWPSPQQRQCTSDLKRGPIEREIRRYLKAHPGFNGLIVNCMGIRADESPARAKAEAFKFNARNSKAGREWYDWLPIHDFTTAGVFETIRAAGQKPHWAYGVGMTRLSCRFCIMASRADLTTAAKLSPRLYRRYVETERRLDQSMAMPAKGRRVFLEEMTGIMVGAGA